MSPHSPGSAARIGFFGGSFDPIHKGHLALAEDAIERADLETLLLCPAFHAPLRVEKPFFEARHRLAMLERIAIQHPAIKVFDHEILQGKTCYTYHTLLEVEKRYPEREILLLLGEDQFQRLPQWKFVEELSGLVTFLVFSRLPDSDGQPPLPGLRFEWMKNDLIDLSSSSIREKIRGGQAFRNDLPSPAYDYLEENLLLPPSSSP